MVTWRLAVVAAVASLVAAFLPVGAPLGLLIVDGVLLVLAVVDWALTVPPGRVPVGRRLPESLVMEETGRIEWDVSNPGTRPLRMALADELAPSLRARTRRVEVVLEPAEARSLSTELVPGRRGEFSPSELVVRTYGPLGLAGRQAARRLESRMRVLPLFRSRREAELRMDRARILEVGLRSARFRGGGTEFEQLRDYTVDDEFRRMDWAATARSGRPIVRDFRAERNQVVLLLLDNGRIMAGQVAGVPRVEHAMDAVMTVTAVATRFGDRVGLVAFDRQVRNVVLPANRPGQRRRVVDAIYALEPALVESDYRRAFLETLVRFPRRAMLVLLTELADEAMQETLLSSLPLILRRHLVVVGAVRDPAVETWAGAVPTEAAASYRKAAAIAALDRRCLFSAQLARLGVDVVDAPPGRLAGQLADRYLQVKATGRL